MNHSWRLHASDEDEDEEVRLSESGCCRIITGSWRRESSPAKCLKGCSFTRDLSVYPAANKSAEFLYGELLPLWFLSGRFPLWNKKNRFTDLEKAAGWVQLGCSPLAFTLLVLNPNSLFWGSNSKPRPDILNHSTSCGMLVDFTKTHTATVSAALHQTTSPLSVFTSVTRLPISEQIC